MNRNVSAFGRAVLDLSPGACREFAFHGRFVNDQELNIRIVALAQSYNMAPEKFLKELQSRNGVEEVYGQVLHEKVVDFLQEHAKIEDVPAGTLK